MKIFRLYFINRLIIAAAIAAVGLSMLTPKAQAAINYGRIIDDSVYEDQNSKLNSASKIDSWLNSNYPSGCISGSFRAPDPLGWSSTQNKMLFGSNVTAGKVIYDAGRIYNINPQVLLSTLQKEQSAVSGGAGCHPNTPNPATATAMTDKCGPGARQCTLACTYSGGCMNIAMGYGCPSYCDVKYEGFSNQVIWAANTLRFAEVRSNGILTGYTGYDLGDENLYYSGPMTKGYRQRTAGGATNYYDGTYTPKDSSTITIVTGATASLYNYTPFKSGNNHFYNIFINWFGDTFGKVATYVNQTFTPSLHAGQVASSYIRYKNTGNVNWYDDTNANANGANPVHLAVTNPINSKSSFGWGWPNLSRPTLTFSAVYESDGTTLAANQHIVEPGQIAKFSFNITVPYGYKTGTYKLYVQPILEGASNWDMGGMAWFSVTVVPNVYKATYVNQTFTPSLHAGQVASSYIRYKNTGNVNWCDDTNANANGANPVHLAVTNPINSKSSFGWGWPNLSRPTLTFSAVYESDGTTLAANQHIVEPGQIAKFSFNITVPYGYKTGTYKLYVQPILEGASNWDMGGMAWFSVTVN